MTTPDDPRAALLSSLRDEVRQHYRHGRVIVAVDAADAAASAAFADGLGEAIAGDGSVVERVGAGDESAARDAVADFRAGRGDAVLVVDGAGLLAPGIRGLWNWSVRLEGGGVGSDAGPGAAAARIAASALVENTDPAHPVRIFGDFC